MVQQHVQATANVNGIKRAKIDMVAHIICNW